MPMYLQIEIPINILLIIDKLGKQMSLKNRIIKQIFQKNRKSPSYNVVAIGRRFIFTNIRNNYTIG